MTNKAKIILFSVLTALIVIVGVVMVAVFGGFHVASDGNRLEVTYDTVITIGNKEEALQKTCEDILSSKGLKFRTQSKADVLDSSSVGETGDKLLTFTFSGSTGLDSLRAAAQQIEERATSEYPDADVYVSVHVSDAVNLNEAAWRGAIALAVAAIVAVVYIGIRYGFPSAVAGFISAICAGLVSVAVFAIIPLPIYSYAPLLYAGVGTVFTLFFWMLAAAKLKTFFKEDTESASAEESVKKGIRGARKYMLLFAIPIAVAFVLLGVLATNATRLFFLPALVPLAFSLLFALFFAPAIMTPLKGKADSAKANKRYVGKQKADAEK